jgi:hypothetical protein
MPAGDLITQDGQIELLATLMGDGTLFKIDRLRGGVRGFRGGEMSLTETEYAHAPGSFVGQTRRPARTVTVALNIKGTTVAATSANVDAMDALWNTELSDPVPLYVRLPGMTKSYVSGVPAGIVIEEDQVVFKHVPALASFRVTDPTIYTP